MNDREEGKVGLPLYSGSFLAPNIIPMMNFDEDSKPRELAWLYRGHNSKLFFFNKSAQVGLPQHRGYDAEFPDIYIQVLKDSNERCVHSNMDSNGSAISDGEEKRKLVHNCKSFRVKPSDILYQEITRKKPNAWKSEQKLFRLNMIPTLVDGIYGFEDGMLVFSAQTDDEQYGLFFYSLQMQ